MIQLTRLNGNPMAVNADLIKYVEAAPDTTITLVTGEKLVVLETIEQVIGLCLAFRSQILQTAWPFADAVLAALSGRTADGTAAAWNGQS